MDAVAREDAVWKNIADASSTPVGLDDQPTAYISSHLMSEMFKKQGFETLVYRIN